VKLAAGVLLGVTILAGPRVQDPVVKQALARFDSDFHRSGAKTDQKIAAVLAVCVHKQEAVVKAIAPSLSRENVPVRIAIARELSRFLAVPGAAPALLVALRNGANGGNKFAPVRIMLLRALGDHRYKEAATEVDKFVDDRDIWVAKAAIDAAGKIRERSSIEPLISQLKRIEGPMGDGEPSINPLWEALKEVTIGGLVEGGNKPMSERELLKNPILASLRNITRQTFMTGKDWDGWWKTNKGSFKVAE
jgi:HEAT repeat protein